MEIVTARHAHAATFRSRFDGWVAASLAAAGVVQIAVIVILAVASPVALLVVVPLVLAIGGVIAWLYRATRYVITDESLLIYAGLVAVDIPLAQITKIEPTRNPLSAPAWSLDRLLISYGQDKSCMISPQDKAGFLSTLRERGVRVA